MNGVFAVLEVVGPAVLGAGVAALTVWLALKDIQGRQHRGEVN